MQRPLLPSFGTLHISKLVVASNSDRAQTSLQRHNAISSRTGLFVHIHRSKWVGGWIMFCTRDLSCPNDMGLQYLTERGEGPSHFLYHKDDSSLIRYHFLKLTSMALQRVGLQG